MPRFVGFTGEAVAAIEEMRIKGLHLPFPVTVDVLDKDKNACIKLKLRGLFGLGVMNSDMVTSPDVSERQGPFTVRFRAEGVEVMRDFPLELEHRIPSLLEYL